MKAARAHWSFLLARGPRKAPAFSLIEVVMAIGIVSFALIAIIGMIPIGLNAMKASVNDTLACLIFQDVSERITGQPYPTSSTNVLYYYDSRGAFVDTNSTNSVPIYKVAVKIAPLDASLTNGALTNANLRAVVVGISSTSSPRTNVTSFYVTPLTGPGWKVLDPANFISEIEL